MKLIIGFFLLVATHLFAQSNDLISLKTNKTNPGNLNGFIHIPKEKTQKEKNSNSAKKPLVVVLHGCLQNAETVARQAGWNKLADEYGFYVLYPQQKMINNPNKCFDWFIKNDVTKDKGEVLSIKQMVDFAVDNFAVDTNKIVVYGLSAGAAMSVALLADYPQTFEAGAILAGGAFFPTDNPLSAMKTMTSPDDRSPQELGATVRAQNPNYTGRYPRLVVMHGTSDLVVNIKNSQQLVQQWTYLHQTDAIHNQKIVNFNQKPNITRFSYYNKVKKEVVIYYEVKNLAHALMIDPGTGAQQGGVIGLFAVDKDFFSTYWIALDLGLIKISN